MNMAKIRVEVCLISARGLRRSSSLWKLQWFAVGWIDPNNKYCTKIDASGSTNPTWKTKFSASMGGRGDSESKLEGLALHVEVYSRDPIFLREKLYGTSTVLLKEFLAKYMKNVSKSGVEEVGSFQLRKKSSGKPHGFVDVSVRIFEDKDGSGSSSSVFGEGLKLESRNNDISLAIENGSVPPFPSQPDQFNLTQPQNFPQTTSPYSMPFPANHSNPSVGGPSYRPPYTRPPPPPPPPSHVGYLPTFLPRNDQLPGGTYVNLPSSGAAPGLSGFGMGVGAGALAAGAVIFGDDFMSGFDLPSGLQDANLNISIDPLY